MKQTRNLWPLGIILTFVIFISGTIGLVVMACAQKIDLVSPDCYEQEIRFQSQLDSSERAQRLGAKVTYEAATRSIRISLPKEQALHPVTGRIHLYRPSAAGLDRQLPLKTDSEGLQAVDATGLRRGLWKVRITWEVAGRNYFLDRSIVVGSPVS